MNNLIKLFWVSRPISWINTAFPFAAAYLLSGGRVDMTFVVATLYFLIPYNLLMYGVNDVFDYESDIRNPRKGGIEGMREQKAFHPTILWAALITNTPFLLFLLSTGSLVSAGVLITIVFFVIAYSIKHLRFKERPVVDSITSSLHFVGPALYGLSFTPFDTAVIPLLVAFFLWGMASHAFGAVQDIIPDRSGHLASIATVFGARQTVRLVVVLYASATLLIAVQPYPVNVIAIAGLMYVINAAPYWLTTDALSGKTNEAWRRFIWLNLIAGFIVTMVILLIYL